MAGGFLGVGAFAASMSLTGGLFDQEAGGKGLQAAAAGCDRAPTVTSTDLHPGVGTVASKSGTFQAAAPGRNTHFQTGRAMGLEGNVSLSVKV